MKTKAQGKAIIYCRVSTPTPEQKFTDSVLKAIENYHFETVSRNVKRGLALKKAKKNKGK